MFSAETEPGKTLRPEQLMQMLSNSDANQVSGPGFFVNTSLWNKEFHPVRKKYDACDLNISEMIPA